MLFVTISFYTSATQKVIKGTENEENIPEVRKRIGHGTASVIHAEATLTTKVLPFYYPHPSYAVLQNSAYYYFHYI